MTDRELMQQALSALEWASDMIPQQKEPVCDCPVCEAHICLMERVAQPQQEWAGLTEDEIEEIARYQDEHGGGPWHLAFARAIEAKLREKNL